MGAPRTGSLGLGWGEQGKCFIKDAAIRVAKDREVWAMEEASRQYKQQVRRSSYLELGGQVVGEGEELDLVQSEKVRCEGCGACQMHLRWGRHRVYGLNGAKGKDKGIRLLN